jgi:serine/threonine-protein kinase
VQEPLDRERWRRVSEILDAVLDLPDGGERAAYLDSACGGDAALRRDVEHLLTAADAPDSFLATPAFERAAPLIAEFTSAAAVEGQRVGPYRLVRELGAGGMAVVWLAEREDGQFQQQVAIKFVKQGLRSREAQRRFLQERQILARLQHPAIARLLDGGVTGEGTPYFVMERVEGVPVTTYCRDRALDDERRLRVFLQICDAVQYAHRNLIVHRDLKPSNILVDGDGHVKLLDFGIAKLTGGPGETAATVERALTPEYAAPEQLRGEPVSTSTDVYALGVVLHEMLAGERPRPGEHTRRLRGDLDRIVARAMHEAPERRYASAEALAADVRRHLDGLPVAARGDALSYRAGKFLRRHRVASAAATLVLLTLVAGLVATTWQARRAAREAKKADAVKEFLKTILAAGDPERNGGREPSLRQLLDAGAQRIEGELRDQPDVQSEVTAVIGSTYQALGEYDRVVSLLRADLDRRRRIDGPRSLAVATLMTHIADALYEQSRFDEAGALYDGALSIARERLGPRAPQVAELLWDVAGVKRNRGDLAGAEAFDKQALDIYTSTAGEDSMQAAGVRESLSILYAQLGRFAESASLQAQVAAARERQLSADHPHTLNSRYNLAYAFVNLGRFDDAVRVAEDVVARQRRVLGPHHDRLAVSLRILARALDQAGRAGDALAPAAEAIAIQTAEFGPEHPQVITDRVWQAVVEAHAGQFAKAEQDARIALAYFDAHPDPRADAPHLRTLAGSVLAETGHLEDADAQISRAAADLRAAHRENVFLAYALDALGDIARRRAQPERARTLALEALPLMERTLDAQHPALAVARVHAGAAQWAAGAPADGERLIRAGLALLESRFPNGHADLATAWLTYADLLRQSGRAADARPLVQKALAWRQTHYALAKP